MKNVQMQAYQFDELDDRGKEKVSNWLNSSNFDDDIYDCEVELSKENLKELGYSNIDVRWSGFYSNCDGASITCRVDVAAFIKRNKYGNKYRSLNYWAKENNMTIDITRRSYYRYADHRGLIVDIDDARNDLDSYYDNISPVSDKAYNQLDSCAEDILYEVADKSQELYFRLRNEYDYHFTEEYIKDMCDTNEYLFDEYGNPIHHLIVVAPVIMDTERKTEFTINYQFMDIE